MLRSQGTVPQSVARKRAFSCKPPVPLVGTERESSGRAYIISGRSKLQPRKRARMPSYFRQILYLLVVLMALEGIVAIWVAAPLHGWELPGLDVPAVYAQ